MSKNVYLKAKVGDVIKDPNGNEYNVDGDCTVIMDSSGERLVSIIDSEMEEYCRNYYWETDEDGQIVTYSENKWGIRELYLMSLVYHVMEGHSIYAISKLDGIDISMDY